MFPVKRYAFSLFLSLLASHVTSQNITGTWEGDLGDEQFLQLNVIQNGNKLCGYTWDFIKRERASYCKAYFEGHYDPEEGEWRLIGTSFMENKGGHLLMRIKLEKNFFDGRITLDGVSLMRSGLLSRLFGNIDSVHLIKVSGRPTNVLENMQDCFVEKKRSKKDSLKIPPVRSKPRDTNERVETVKTPDTLEMPIKKPLPIPPPATKTDSIYIPKPVDVRRNKEQSRIEIDTKTITLNVYDNAVVDNDTVSIYYNGRLLLSHQRLSEKPIEIKLELDEKQTRHEILLFAENLGGIPPNTALIVIYAGTKRYQLNASASLEENAVLVFEYKPK